MKKYSFAFLAMVFLCLIFSGLAPGENKGNAKPSSGHKLIKPDEAANKVAAIANKHFIATKDAAVSGSPTEESGLYKVNLTFNHNTQPFYLTKDGAMLIMPNGFIDIAKFEESVKKQQQPPKEEIPKTTKPTVELFVMSLCPYGIKAEKLIFPVVKSFGDKIDFRIKFIVTAKGDTLNDVVSLHGIDEVREDARQVAIIKYYPDRLPAYIDKLETNSCLVSCGAVKLDDYWKKSAKELRMDVKKIESFAYGEAGMTVLKQDDADTRKYEVNASPTLVINGVKSMAIYRGAKPLADAIRSAFINAPEISPEKTGKES
jgi:hypothetical protein